MASVLVGHQLGIAASVFLIVFECGRFALLRCERVEFLGNEVVDTFGDTVTDFMEKCFDDAIALVLRCILIEHQDATLAFACPSAGTVLDPCDRKCIFVSKDDLYLFESILTDDALECIKHLIDGRAALLGGLKVVMDRFACFILRLGRDPASFAPLLECCRDDWIDGCFDLVIVLPELFDRFIFVLNLV